MFLVLKSNTSHNIRNVCKRVLYKIVAFSYFATMCNTSEIKQNITSRVLTFRKIFWNLTFYKYLRNAYHSNKMEFVRTTQGKMLPQYIS